MIGQQDCVMLMRNSSHRLSKLLVPWSVIRDQRQCADSHYVVGRDWRQDICGVHVREAGDGHRVRRMQMHDSTGACAHVVDSEMQEALLRLLVSADQSTFVIEFGERRRIKLAKRRVRRCHQPTIVHAHADVAGGTGCQPTAENAGAEAADCFTCFGISRIHLSWVVC